MQEKPKQKVTFKDNPHVTFQPVVEVMQPPTDTKLKHRLCKRERVIFDTYGQPVIKK